MSFPPASLLESTQAVWLVSLLVGFAFGFVLERAGFGRSTKLAAQFYLTDMTVFKVMFGAIVTAGLGLVVADGLGLADVEAIAAQGASYTFVAPMVLGGLLLGAGFVISGYCPGTSMVATASGNLDGLAALGGIVIGGLLFGEAYPLLAGFSQSGNLGHTFLPDVFGLPRAVIMGLVTVMALGMFLGAEWVERWSARRTQAEAPPSSSPTPARRVVFAGLAAIAALGLMPISAAAPSHEHPRHAEMLDVEGLAHRLTAEPWALRVIDLRDREDWLEARVPGSESVPLDDLEQLALNVVQDDRAVILIAEHTVNHVPELAERYSGRIFTLKGGFDLWRGFALAEPAPVDPAADPAQRASWAFQSALHGYLTGRQAVAPPPAPVRAVRVRAAGAGGGCN